MFTIPNVMRPLGDAAGARAGHREFGRKELRNSRHKIVRSPPAVADKNPFNICSVERGKTNQRKKHSRLGLIRFKSRAPGHGLSKPFAKTSRFFSRMGKSLASGGQFKTSWLSPPTSDLHCFFPCSAYFVSELGTKH